MLEEEGGGEEVQDVQGQEGDNSEPEDSIVASPKPPQQPQTPSPVASSPSASPDSPVDLECPPLDPSDYHVFTSHFFTTLTTSGFKSVKSWVKDIPRFLKKKFVFVPICIDMHWSLCVIVNPGAYFKTDGTVDEKLGKSRRVAKD